MSTKVWIIRRHQFNYNGEFYYVDKTQIHSLYYQAAEARNAYQRLEVAAARQFYLHQVETFFHADRDFLQKMNQFVFSRCGETICDHRNELICGKKIPASLTDEDSIIFVTLSAMNSYSLHEEESEPCFYVAWLPHQQRYYTQIDAHSHANIVYHESRTQLIQKLSPILNEFQQADLQRFGKPKELSDHPELLGSAINQCQAAKYHSRQQQLDLSCSHLSCIIHISGMLKQPFIELHLLPLKQILKLTQQQTHADLLPL